MNFDPHDPIWPNRDRFVLSNGHASMLRWSVLHLTKTQAVNADYERVGKPAVTLEDIRRFRQIDSRAPGHPEYRWVSGVETTTGPLGAGVATSVGMAIAQKWLAHRSNKPGFQIFDYNLYAVCGDGCMMEGVASEAGLQPACVTKCVTGCLSFGVANEVPDPRRERYARQLLAEPLTGPKEAP